VTLIDIGVGLLVASVSSTSPAIAQCTDVDGDGYFYEVGCGTLRDCDDTSPFVRPGAPQQCDGINNDCNDPSWPAVPPAEVDSDGDGYPQCQNACEVQVSAAGAMGGYQLLASKPNMVASGSGFALCFRVSNSHDNYYRAARLDSWGRKVGADVDVRGYIISFGPHVCAVASSGDGMGVAFTEYSTIGFAGFDALMAHTAATTPVISSELIESPAIIWTGQEYGLVWTDWRDWEYGKPEIYFARIASNGERIGSEVRVTNAAGLSEFPSVVWTGSEYGVAWQDNRDGHAEIHFARLDASGTTIGSEVRITTHAPGAGVGNRPSLASNGSGYGLAWMDSREGTLGVYFAALDGSGGPMGPHVWIAPSTASSPAPYLMATGAGYFLAWQFDGTHTLALDASGTPIGAEQLLPSGQTIAWNGTDTAIAYSASRTSGVFDIYFTRGHCHDCSDADATVYPGAPQVCDVINNDCSDSAWPAVPNNELDVDSDGFTACTGDCDDHDPTMNPAALDLPGDVKDQNCDGTKSCDPAGPWRNHGTFVSCVVQEAHALATKGRITAEQEKALITTASKSNAGKQ